MDDVQGDILGPTHGTTPAAVTTNNTYETNESYLITAHWCLRKPILIPYVNELGQRSSYALELENTYIFIHSISCLHLLTFKSQAAMYGCVSHLGHVTSILIFISLSRKANITNLVHYGPLVSEKSHF